MIKNLILLLILFFPVHIAYSQILFDDGPLYGEGFDNEDYTLSNSKWNKLQLKYYILNTSAHLTELQRESAIVNAFNTWQDNSNLTFEQVFSPTESDIKISWQIGNHGDGNPFENGVLAHAFFPPPLGGTFAGELHFNDSYQWNVDGSSYDLETTALHEIGHLLGIRHSTNYNAVMYPSYLGVHRTLHLDDLFAIWSLYGHPFKIEGDSLLCESNAYTINNLPTAFSVHWILDNNNLSFVSTQDSTTVIVRKNEDGNSTLSAVITYNSNPLYSISKTIHIGRPELGELIFENCRNENTYWIEGNIGNFVSVSNNTMHYNEFEFEIYRLNQYFQLELVQHLFQHSPLYEFTTAYVGWYTVRVRGINDCGYSEWSEAEIETISNNHNPDSENVIKPVISFNSSSQCLNIEWPNESPNRLSRARQKEKEPLYDIMLFDNMKQIKNLHSNQPFFQLSIADFPNGIYYVCVIKDGKNYSRVIIKQ